MKLFISFSAICYVTKPSTVAVAQREWKRVLRKQMSVKVGSDVLVFLIVTSQRCRLLR